MKAVASVGEAKADKVTSQFITLFIAAFKGNMAAVKDLIKAGAAVT